MRLRQYCYECDKEPSMTVTKTTHGLAHKAAQLNHAWPIRQLAHHNPRITCLRARRQCLAAPAPVPQC